MSPQRGLSAGNSSGGSEQPKGFSALVIALLFGLGPTLLFGSALYAVLPAWVVWIAVVAGVVMTLWALIGASSREARSWALMAAAFAVVGTAACVYLARTPGLYGLHTPERAAASAERRAERERQEWSSARADFVAEAETLAAGGDGRALEGHLRRFPDVDDPALVRLRASIPEMLAAERAREAAAERERDAQAQRDRDEALTVAALQSDVQEAMRQALRDPDSVRYSGVNAVRSAEGQVRLCGRVNARNGFGGYAGEQAFIASADGLTFPASTAQWSARCEGLDIIQRDLGM